MTDTANHHPRLLPFLVSNIMAKEIRKKWRHGFPPSNYTYIYPKSLSHSVQKFCYESQSDCNLHGSDGCGQKKCTTDKQFVSRERSK